MKILLTLLVVFGLTSATPEEFSAFKRQFSKSYSTKDEAHRYNVFKSNLKKIEEHNSNPDRTWSMQVTEFADLSAEEFKATLIGYKKLPMTGQEFSEPRMYSKELPASVDWRDAGVITDAKNQGSCGSCWAFATTEQIESYAMLNNITVPKLSTQEVTSCSPNTLHCGGRGGCVGSVPQLGYSYIQLFGLTTDAEYPYYSGVTTITGRCKYDIDRRTPVVGITGYNSIPSNDLEATLQHLANVGPLAVAADATLWQLYGSGVFGGCNYENNIGLNHAVQLVGYGTDDQHGDYWIVRNSWGKFWGEHGYIRLQREAEQTCGVNSTPMDGTACEGGPGNDEQVVCGQCGLLFDSTYPLGAYPFHA